MWALLSLLALAGCSDDTLYIADEDPTVNILSPVDGEEFDEGEIVPFLGNVDDDRGIEDLAVEWISSIDGPLPDVDPPDEEGFVEFGTASLSEGSHVITLRATDSSSHQSEDLVLVKIVPVPEAPTVEVIHPAKGENALEATPFVFMATVADRQDNAESLAVSLTAEPGGFVCYMDIDGRGNSQCSATLALGSYLLTFAAEDLDGNVATAQANFQVLDPLDYDFDGDGYSTNGGDCNDSNDSIYPGAPELCDGIDNDCSKLTGIDIGSDCYDDDGDGYCEVPPCMNTANTASDCDDGSASISPVATEVLNGVDDDCDGFVDEGTNVYDDDGDGYCESPPCINAPGMEVDCNDGDFGIYPDAIEICSDGVDNNCDGSQNERNGIGCTDFYYDFDGDTYGVAGARECWCDAGAFPYTGRTSTDCYDQNANAYPGQTAYFTAHRGDRSYDFDCSGSEELQYTDISGGCAWDMIYISCECNGEGWDTRPAPSCGGSDLYLDSCSATYDPICYGLCMLSRDPITCLLNQCGATCDPEYSSRAQGCR